MTLAIRRPETGVNSKNNKGSAGDKVQNSPIAELFILVISF